MCEGEELGNVQRIHEQTSSVGRCYSQPKGTCTDQDWLGKRLVHDVTMDDDGDDDDDDDENDPNSS